MAWAGNVVAVIYSFRCHDDIYVFLFEGRGCAGGGIDAICIIHSGFIPGILRTSLGTINQL